MSNNLDRMVLLVQEFGELGGRVLQKQLGIPADQAIGIGLQIAQGVCTEFAGQNLYIPMGFSQKITIRDEAMYHAYHVLKKPIPEIAKMHGLSVKQVYERIRLFEACLFARNQGQLFPEDPAN